MFDDSVDGHLHALADLEDGAGRGVKVSNP